MAIPSIRATLTQAFSRLSIESKVKAVAHPARALSGLQVRRVSTSAETGGTSYPFASSAITSPSSATSSSIKPTTTGRSTLPTRRILESINAALRSDYDPSGALTSLFSRRSPKRVPSGSVLVVQSYTNASKTSVATVSGVLIGVRRRGVDTAFTLRTIVNKTGMEMRFPLYSPMIKAIRVVERADKPRGARPGSGSTVGLKRTRRAKLYYLRDDERKLMQMSNIVKQQAKQQAGR